MAALNCLVTAAFWAAVRFFLSLNKTMCLIMVVID